MFEEIVQKLTELDLWSMGIGVVLTVATFYVIMVIRKNRANKKVQ
jgi:hypothetical protein